MDFCRFHYAQMIINGDFSQFDFRDKKKNQDAYGRDTPPPYNLKAITAPINLYYSRNDDTAIIENAVKLRHQLPNVKSSYLIPISDFAHVGMYDTVSLVHIDSKKKSYLKKYSNLFDRLHLFAPREKSTLQSSNQ